ncbi:MAG: ferritin [Nitrospinae bacterium]|nr:ferritin [Nitrospinota bacterium]
MIKKVVEEALSEQINAELYSAYFYMSMGNYLNSIDLKGLAAWMSIQVQEELMHASKFYNYIHERGGKISVKAIKAPPTDWDSPLALFEATLAHEEKVTGLINNLVDIAIAEKDHATNNFLQWFVSEQVEEESNVSDIVSKLRLIKGDSHALFMIDKELGQRVPLFTMPVQGVTN